jgi:hypothetical protein
LDSAVAREFNLAILSIFVVHYVFWVVMACSAALVLTKPDGDVPCRALFVLFIVNSAV